MNFTTYHNLQKPLDTEKYNIGIHNTNADIIDSVAGDSCQFFQGFDHGVADDIAADNFSGRFVFLVGRIAYDQGAELAVFGAVQFFGKIGAAYGKAVGNGIIDAGGVFADICAERVVAVLSGSGIEQTDGHSYVFVEP